VLSKPIACVPLARSNVEAADFFLAVREATEMRVERDHHKVVKCRVVGQDQVLSVGEENIAYATYWVPSADEEVVHRLDHVLVGEER